MKLPDLGFSKGTIVETIVSTYSTDGQPNAAPMGVIMENEQRVIIRIYNSSLTYRNLLLKKCAVVNVTSDVETFYQTAFKEANLTGKIPLDWFEKAESVDAPRLRSAEATVEIAVAEMKPLDEGRTEAVCEVRLVKAAKTFPKAYCRALFATIEAIIHATRVKAYLSGDEKQREQALKLLGTIEDYRALVNRVAPNSCYAEIMADLTKRVNSWRVES
ncbi:MAG: DUF447 family protein [Candidatus Bathyarchaeota archaeon]|nr:DUF447 family protein [Candidatus Bathyarchaeota archaeon]